MKTTAFLVIGSFLLTTLMTGSLAAQQQRTDGAEKKPGNVFADLRDAAQDVAGDVQQGYEKVRDAVLRMGVATRIYARLHWDKMLTNATVSIDVTRDGHAVLRGTVPSEQAKTKAESLTLDTVGVNQVENQLKVAPPTDAAPRHQEPSARQ